MIDLRPADSLQSFSSIMLVSDIDRLKNRISAAVAIIIALQPGAVSANCTNPAAIAGSIVYNADYSTMQFCNGTSWIGMAQATGITETDPKIGTLTSNNFCTSNAGGTGIVCTTAGISIASITATGTASSSTYLRGDGTWSTPAGGNPGGSATQVQFNSSGSFGGSANLVWDNTNSRLGVGTTTPSVSIESTGVVKAPTYYVAPTAGGAAPSSATGGSIGTLTANGYCTANSAGTQIVCTTASIPISSISATGTASASTYLRGDGSWSTVSSSQWINGASSAIYYSTGNVGIGTTSPGTKLDVLGVVRANDSTVYTQIAPSSTIGYIVNTSNHPLGLIANNTEYLRVSASGGGFWTGGSVGIGTTSPLSKFNVYDSSTGIFPLLVSSGQTGTTSNSNFIARFQSLASGRDAAIQLSDNVANSANIGMVSGNLYFTNNGIENMRITNAGNVGIGTSSPAFPLDIYRNGSDATINLSRGSSANAAYTSYLPVGTLGSSNVNWVTGIPASSNAYSISTWDGSTLGQRLTVQNGGNVGIGTTAPSTALQVNGTVTATAYANMSSTNTFQSIKASLNNANGGTASASCPAGFTLIYYGLITDYRTQSGTSGWNNGGTISCTSSGNTLSANLTNYSGGSASTTIECQGLCVKN